MSALQQRQLSKYSENKWIILSLLALAAEVVILLVVQNQKVDAKKAMAAGTSG